MVNLKSYSTGRWHTGHQRSLRHAVTGEEIAQCGSEGLDFAAMVEFARQEGCRSLASLNFQERGALLKQLAGVLNEHREEFHQIAATYGATPRDAAIDVDGGIGTLAFYSSLGRKQLPASNTLADGDVSPLSKGGHFVGRHLYVARQGVAVQINAYNFPAWGMLEKLAPALLAGMPTIVKPATRSAWLTFRMVEVMVESGFLPKGALQLICGSVGDLLDHLDCQDLVSFTGSAATGQKIRSHPNLIRNSVKVNVEADSLNCAVLGPDVDPESPTLKAFIKEVRSEMTVKAGQKCTAIRRILVPEARAEDIVSALEESLRRTRVGNPAEEGIRMGPLVDEEAAKTASEGLTALKEEAEVVFGGSAEGSFFHPALLRCDNSDSATAVHEIEIFGPVATVLQFRDADHAIELANRGGGSLVGSIFSDDDDFANQVALGIAPYHGRVMVMNAMSSPESTGHGVVMPHLTHGGPGRAGGGEELGGLRAVKHHMHRVAFQGDPERLKKLLE